VTGRQWTVLVVLTFIALSCAPQRQLIKKVRTLPPEEVINRVLERNALIRTVRGNGEITVETREASNSGSFDVYLKKPDSLRVEFRGPFGIHFGTLALSSEQFLFYNRRNNTAIIGKPDGTTLQSLFHLKMRFDEILNAFAGEFPLHQNNGSLARFYVDQDLYVLEYRDGDGMREYRIDGDNFLVMSYRLLDVQGNSTLTAFASRTTDASDIPMSSLLRIIFPKERRSITIAYDDLQVNEPVACSFILPSQVEIINQ